MFFIICLVFLISLTENSVKKPFFKKLLQELIQSENPDFSKITKYFQYTWYLVDGDGFTVILMYNPELCMYYENRKSGAFHVDVIDPKDFSRDVNDFIHYVEAEFNEPLSLYKSQMLEEIERVILLYINQSN